MKVWSVMALGAGLALGQQDVLYFNERVPGPGNGDKRVMHFQGPSREVVKGSPYSADKVTETTQTLADGNRIKHTNRSSIARDGEGRTRIETTIEGLGAIGKMEAPLTNIVIEDPVGKASYMLDPKSKVATKTKVEGVMMHKLGAAKIVEDVVITRSVEARGPAQSNVMIQRMRIDSDRNVNKEDLGMKMIEGVEARGMRIKMTIPAGEVGNERPLEVVTETWYSDQLKAVVLSKHSDPRMGESTTKLMNVKLGEPSRSLFEVPADYRVEEGQGMRFEVRDVKEPVIQIKEEI